MASSKEGLVVILDVSENNKELYEKESSFLEQQKHSCNELLQRKIFAGKKDEVAFILMGTKNTDNILNAQLDGYSNIIEAIPMQIPDWNTVNLLTNSLNDIPCKPQGADWLDTLIVAMDVLKREEAKKFKHLKIVLFHNFLNRVDDSNVETVIDGLKGLNVELVVVSNFVEYIDDEEQVLKVKAQFSTASQELEEQKQSEAIVTQIINSCNGMLCNFDYATRNMVNQLHPAGRPWFWYSRLEIGTKISIQICCTILIKEEKRIKWKTESMYEEANVFKATEYFKNGEKFNADTEDLIKAYMLGSSPIPYDTTLGIQKVPTEKGVKCIGFSHQSNISSEYFCGTDAYLLLPKIGAQKSEKMFNALTLSMSKNNLVMICRRVYADGYKPKFNVLIPNFKHSIPCFSMFELYCSEQHINREFPPLRQRKTTPSPAQYAAIESLIASMNLNESKDENKPRKDFNNELMPLNILPNLSEDYITQIATERILGTTKNITSSIRGKDTAITVPQEILEKSKVPLQEVKELFKLEEIKKAGNRELIRHLGDIPAESNEADTIEQQPLDYKLFGTIGTIHPAKDFMALIERDVLNEKDKEKQISNFDSWSYEMRTVLSDLIFKSVTQPTMKIIEALKIYRENANVYNPIKYNDWLREIKEIVLNRKMFSFWSEVIVENKLGLLLHSNETVEEIEKFYKINEASQTTAVEEDIGNVDDMFDEM